jgi:hypothetical protein
MLGNYGLCLCCNLHRSAGKRLSICEPRITKEHATVFQAIWGAIDVMASPKVVDGDDPVYEIGDEALRGAFEGWQQLETVKFNFVTNIMYYGCAQLCKDCPNLKSVQFSNLKRTESGAFMNAFQGCVKLQNVRFPNLCELGDCAFSGTFAGCTNTIEITFPALTYIGPPSGDSAFSGISAGTLTFPALTDIAVVAPFINCSAKLNLPNLQSIGDNAFYGYRGHTLSLPNVTELDFGAEVGLTPFPPFVKSEIKELEVPRMSMDYVRSKFFYDNYHSASNYLGLSSGCIIKCEDGDIVVP